MHFTPAHQVPISKPAETIQESKLWPKRQAKYQREHVTMNDLEKLLGEAITVKELSEYLGINQKTLRENYRQFGGIKIGRHYRFFTKEVANALEKRQKDNCPSQEERAAEREGLSDTEGSEGVGSKDEKAVRRRVERQDDKHGLFS